MPKDPSERRTYRKSPGRQYGYEYDPLRDRSGQDQSERIDGSTQGERWSTRGETPGRPSTPLAQRPNLRRTRQLVRQSILASKTRTANEDEEQIEQQEPERSAERAYEELDGGAPYNKRYVATRSDRTAQPRMPSTQELMEDEDEWQDYGNVDPDIGYEDPLDVQTGHSEMRPMRSPALPPATRGAPEIPMRSPVRSRRPIEPEEYEDEDYEYEDDQNNLPPPRRRARKQKVSRRGLLIGLGAAAVGGTVAAYELGPRIPQAVGNVGANIEHQLQDAFNKGLAQGADAVRKDFVTSLENLEGFTLESAAAAAKLTRIAYDVFVSPIIQFGSNIASNFLNVMLRAFISGRRILAVAGQDNDTLAAIQKVLESWVAQITKLPQQVDTITNTDLDGAQAYLRALQRKIEEEKAKLNSSGQKTTPIPQSTPKK